MFSEQAVFLGWEQMWYSLAWQQLKSKFEVKSIISITLLLRALIYLLV